MTTQKWAQSVHMARLRIIGSIRGHEAEEGSKVEAEKASSAGPESEKQEGLEAEEEVASVV
ncbi:uncharacterized protein A1O5_05484 [Cladophialophora psammophila CBS 110553]|uniref:Uncharacterized protein n=1 Tax=Cladophialophora psammophila CBS 110553 TaxID=1182543 RepID=W9X416_9EURO|nr:uncharacterized protein A1O5_05484 [Cladophialophora psammophila CBS 110553]EXJ71676.1 hypothetical protein A1O5_05484 [Cladophialophora psammophila CBS 110553]